ncbi:hypothetical protein GCM10022225_30290 [Plantactinospora mayteni]|uniref:Endonuclease/exonuclease/phosphatase domain-containing protein n=1 Tax=Plantactinospora mayteni TaxID=566021 RepID=A0ABQ4EVJ3_9ACTN|nr:endonuclease/exonuclease/phosphatase family protein [Plantactinospora mayteni]GIG98665.1 hypothetical protein Pma05_52380 [Plantactinospora mayteni]
MNRLAARRLGALVLTLTMLAPVGCRETPEPPPNGGVAVKVLTYNTRGLLRESKGADHIDSDRWRFVDVLVGRISTERPQIVMLQEICASQVDELAHQLSTRYPMSIAAMVDDGPQKGCPAPRRGQSDPTHQRFGKAILTVGAAAPIVPPQTGAAHGIGCVRWSGYPGFKACVLHTAPEEGPGVGEAFAGWQAALPGPLVLGGDFNAVPTSRSLDRLYSRRVPMPPAEPDNPSLAFGFMYEAAMCIDDDCEHLVRAGEATYARSLLGDLKIDYIFADDQHFAPRAEARVEDTSDDCGGKGCSDHRMLWGEFHVEKAAPDADLPAVADGQLDVRAIRLDPARRIVTVNPVYVPRGAEAIAQACEADNVKPDAEWCNDYYVRDADRNLYDVPIAPEATVKLYFTPGVTCAEEPCTVGLDQAAEVLAEWSSRAPGLLGTIVVRNGQVVALNHIYTP